MFLTELLAAIPSIVYGLWGIFVLVPAVRALETSLPDSCRQLPLFTGPPLGLGMLSAALVLAIMVIPFTSSVAREVLKSVPGAQREGAYALGATRFEAIRAALFYARTGIVGAVMLGFGRALGETMAVTMVIGNNPQVSASLFAPQYTMAAVIANEFTEAADELYLSRAGRNRARAVHHHADRQLAVAAADLEHGAQRRDGAGAEPAAAAIGRGPHDARPRSASCCRRRSSAFCALSVLIALVPLAFILFFVVSQGIRAVNLEFFTHMPRPVGEPGGGMANAIVGTLILTGLGVADGGADRHRERHLHVGVRRHPLRVGRRGSPPTR